MSESSDLKSERAELLWKVTELIIHRKYGAQKPHLYSATQAILGHVCVSRSQDEYLLFEQRLCLIMYMNITSGPVMCTYSVTGQLFMSLDKYDVWLKAYMYHCVCAVKNLFICAVHVSVHV